MSKIAQVVRKTKAINQPDEEIVNFMNGKSYIINPLDTLKIVTTSSIFGEPSYYRNGEFTKEKRFDSKFNIDELVKKDTVLLSKYAKKSTSEIMESVIDNALDYDFKGTLEFAVSLRSNEYNMRLNPQIIMVRAAMHPKRKEFTEQYKGLFAEINNKVMSRLDEPATQLTYWLHKHSSKKGIPTILKKSWAKKYENATRYQLAKYKNSEIGMIDTMRICHPKGDKQPAINELLNTGNIKFDDNNVTWEKYISENGSNKDTWEWVIDNIFAIEIDNK